MKITFLGTGNAANVPVYGCTCNVCSRAKVSLSYQRRSACVLIETDKTRILVDAGLTDLERRFPAGELSNILLTHYHMDHVQGLFPIRWGKGLSIQVIGPEDAQGCDDLHKHQGILDFSKTAKPFETIGIGDLTITPVPLNHSKLTLGYVFSHQEKTFAYLTDTLGLPSETEAYLKDNRVDILALDCSFPPQPNPPKGHNDVTTALQSIQAVKPMQAYLTHIGHDLDNWLFEHAGKLPLHISIAQDNLCIEL